MLLPPGIHQWQSDTLKYERSIDLNNAVIPLGPYTLLTGTSLALSLSPLSALLN